MTQKIQCASHGDRELVLICTHVLDSLIDAGRIPVIQKGPDYLCQDCADAMDAQNVNIGCLKAVCRDCTAAMGFLEEERIN
jgi:hypothetical protein